MGLCQSGRTKFRHSWALGRWPSVTSVVRPADATEWGSHFSSLMFLKKKKKHGSLGSWTWSNDQKCFCKKTLGKPSRPELFFWQAKSSRTVCMEVSYLGHRVAEENMLWKMWRQPTAFVHCQKYLIRNFSWMHIRRLYQILGVYISRSFILVTGICELLFSMGLIQIPAGVTSSVVGPRSHVKATGFMYTVGKETFIKYIWHARVCIILHLSTLYAFKNIY